MGPVCCLDRWLYKQLCSYVNYVDHGHHEEEQTLNGHTAAGREKGGGEEGGGVETDTPSGDEQASIHLASICTSCSLLSP